MRSSATARRSAPALAALALAGVLALPAAAGQPAPAQQVSTYLVTAAPGQLAAVVADLRSRGVEVTKELVGIGVAVVEAVPSAVGELRRDVRVAGVSADSTVTVQGSVYEPGKDVGSLYNVERIIDARDVWSKTTGKGIDVAVLDTGVTPVAGLNGTGKVVHGPDLSFDSQLPAMRHLDGFGHGTHMAGIIAGRDARANPAKSADSVNFMGVAPDARIVSVKVADAWGNADVSQVIAGIDWVVQNRRASGLNIRVLNLSLGTPSTQAYGVDPLAHAAEQAWHNGIVVVASAGNNARGDGQLLNPAYNPWVLAVGASDSRGTLTTTDDLIPEFSSRGDGYRNPNLVAPGRSIQSLRVPGSYLDQQYGATAALGERFFRGSGTSQAAAVVSGAAALLLQHRPGLTPDDVKDVLEDSAEFLYAYPSSQGHGQLRVEAALHRSPTYSRQYHSRSSGSGALEAARGGYYVEAGGVALTGERDIHNKAFSAGTHATAAKNITAWSGGTWGSTGWTGGAFGSDGRYLTTAWTGTDWTGTTWSTRVSGTTSGTWDGRSWAGGYWSGRSWAGRSWAGRSWASATWG